MVHPTGRGLSIYDVIISLWFETPPSHDLTQETTASTKQPSSLPISDALKVFSESSASRLRYVACCICVLGCGLRLDTILLARSTGPS